MKDIPVGDLLEISGEIHEAAVKVGCTDVAVTGKIWPGAKANGPPESAARFVEFSWMRAAVVNGEAIFEEADPKRFLDLLIYYGLEDSPNAQPLRQAAPTENEAPGDVAAEPVKTTLTADVSPATKEALQRRAAAAGMPVGAFLDLVFGDT